MGKKDIVRAPLDVPKKMRQAYAKNYTEMTHGSGRLMLFAGDQKIEHLNGDFFGPNIHEDDGTPEHLFRIASKGNIGVFATQLGLIAQYGEDYPRIQYLVKLNSKSNIVKTFQRDPESQCLVSVKDVVRVIRDTGLKIRGVGYTLYLGSEYESTQLREAAQVVYDAHQNGLVAVLWVYPRGKAVSNERDSHLIAGACGVAACLGSDFVKVNYPVVPKGQIAADAFKEAINAAGRTKVICAGGSTTDQVSFLKTLDEQLKAGASGNATGRNIHQRSLEDAIKFCNAIYALTVEKKPLEEAVKIWKK